MLILKYENILHEWKIKSSLTDETDFLLQDPKFILKPVVEPPYNPLDKSLHVDHRLASVRSRKLPFSKEPTITTEGTKTCWYIWPKFVVQE